MKRPEKGSVSILASLSISMVCALLMALLELSRAVEMQKIAKISTDLAAESLYANYERTLWDEYQLLGVEAGDSELCSKSSRIAYIKDLVERGLYASGQNEGSLFQSTIQCADINGITYFTDQSGRAFEAAVSAYMGNNVAKELYDELEDLCGKVKELEDSDIDVEGKIDKAADVLGMSKKTNSLPVSTSVRRKQNAGNPIGTVSKIKGGGILRIVLKSGTKISGKKIDISNSLLRRPIEAGDGEAIKKDWYQALVTEAYIMKHLSSFQDTKGQRALDYEIEYLIAGKKSDEANLKAVVARIFAVREVANFMYAISDTKMMAEAGTLATAISVASWQPWMKDVVKYGILASWAYAESILDLRALMDGKKVALIKNATQWSSKLSNLSELVSGDFQAKECKEGIDYQTYLAIFTFGESTKKRAYRALDVMEQTVRVQEDRESFCINNVMLESNVELIYQFKPVFAPIKDLLHVEAYSRYSYRKAGA